MQENLQRLFDAIEKHCRPATLPVAVKLAGEQDLAPQKMKTPRTHAGNRLAVCQGMSIARTYGWSMAFHREDHACPLPLVFMGHIDPASFLEGGIASFYQADDACRKAMEASYPRWPAGRYTAVWLSPLNKCEFEPDLVVVYGMPAQVLAMIHAANFGHGPGIASVSTGRYGCAHWIAGVVQADACTYMIPGPGERIFAGAQDHEMSFAIPFSKVDSFVEGLAYVRSKGAYKYPVPNLSFLSEPRIPSAYWHIETKDS